MLNSPIRKMNSSELLEALPKDIKKILVHVSSKIVMSEEVAVIMLYGSYAKGTWNASSDIDMAVFLRDNIDDMHYFYKKFNRITMNSGYDFQIQVFNQVELEEPNGIVEEIVRFGVCITDIGKQKLGE
jgi:predicted nucleotidyltransferase